MYVLDPFSLAGVRAQLADSSERSVRSALAVAGEADLAYSVLVSRLRYGGVPFISRRLAVVISKADLLRRAGVALPADSEGVADWLTAMGHHNLVMSAAQEFAEVRYFAVTSGYVAPDRLYDPGAPLRWLLQVHGVRVPAGTAAVPGLAVAAAAPADRGPGGPHPSESARSGVTGGMSPAGTQIAEEAQGAAAARSLRPEDAEVIRSDELLKEEWSNVNDGIQAIYTILGPPPLKTLSKEA